MDINISHISRKIVESEHKKWSAKQKCFYKDEIIKVNK